jgi:hypothetical protein
VPFAANVNVSEVGFSQQVLHLGRKYHTRCETTLPGVDFS